MLILSTIVTISSANTQKKSIDSNPTNADYSHAILTEFFTITTCVPCKNAHQALYQLYYEGWHSPYFYYITYVYNKNNNSNHRKNELQVAGAPTIAFDGGYRQLIGAGEIEEEKTRYNSTIIKCAARDVYDIDLSLNVEWLGAVNNHPEDGQTGIPIEAILNWTVTEMKIDVTAKNNDASDYDGHIHVQVTECNSSLWIDKYGKPYTFEFKDYALNEDMPLDSGDTFSETIYWDGMDHDDAGGDEWEPHIFDYIIQENTMVFATVFDKDNDKYVDETTGFLAGVDTDPKLFDVYFGDTNPPPKVISKGAAMKYDPPGDLNWTDTYYWKVDVWNDLDEKTEGKVWSFTTRGNSAPYVPYSPKPWNESLNEPIDIILEWLGGDPDGDETKYDIYFGEFDPFENPPQVEFNHTEDYYDPSPIGTLKFDTKYAWKIVSWDKYGEKAVGPKWNFKTEQNYPPNPAYNPTPPDKQKNVSVNATLYWNGSDPNSGDTLRYDVYFGEDPNPPLKSANQEENYYDPNGPDDMDLFEDYYWRIVTRDKMGEETTGPEWNFTTGLNPPPTPPEIDGPNRGVKQVSYNFTFVSTDPDNQTIKYYIDWDDETSNETIYFNSSEIVTLSHTWESNGEYVITARAEDWYESKSGISTFVVNIPRIRTSAYQMFSRLLMRFLDEFPFFRIIVGL
jgi:hypothetical protein